MFMHLGKGLVAKAQGLDHCVGGEGATRQG